MNKIEALQVLLLYRKMDIYKRKKADVSKLKYLDKSTFLHILNLEFPTSKFNDLLGATERNRTVIICMASIGTNRCTTAA